MQRRIYLLSLVISFVLSSVFMGIHAPVTAQEPGGEPGDGQTYELTVTTTGNCPHPILAHPLGNPPGVYPAGTLVTLTANSCCGYRFVRWSGSYNSTDNPIYVTMNSDKQIIADFESKGNAPLEWSSIYGGCGAPSRNIENLLPDLRNYRDLVIVESPRGKELVHDLYEYHSEQLASVLIRNPNLIGLGSNLFRKHASSIEAVLNGKEMQITPSELDEVRDFLDMLGESSEPDLRDYILSIQDVLNRKDLRDFGILVVDRKTTDIKTKDDGTSGEKVPKDRISETSSARRRINLTTTWGALKNSRR